VLISGNMIPSAPASRADFVAGSSMEGTRTHGEHPVSAVAATIAWTLSGPIGPCSWSIITTSAPAVARACVATGDGMRFRYPLSSGPSRSRSLMLGMTPPALLPAPRRQPPAAAPDPSSMAGRASVDEGPWTLAHLPTIRTSRRRQAPTARSCPDPREHADERRNVRATPWTTTCVPAQLLRSIAQPADQLNKEDHRDSRERRHPLPPWHIARGISPGPLYLAYAIICRTVPACPFDAPSEPSVRDTRLPPTRPSSGSLIG
jgi:hypothetical protein